MQRRGFHRTWACILYSSRLEYRKVMPFGNFDDYFFLRAFVRKVFGKFAA